MRIYARGLIYGVGRNDAPYNVNPTIDGKQVMCAFYAKWQDMLRRCYDEAFQKRQPTYKGCRVDPQWHSFMCFRAWMETQDWEGNELDKDILGDGKLYSPETCVFVPKALNMFTVDRAAGRGAWPIGVSFDHNRQKFQAKINVNGRSKNLGRFDTQLEAHLAWASAKAGLALDWAARMTDQRIAEALNRFVVRIIEGTLATQ